MSRIFAGLVVLLLAPSLTAAQDVVLPPGVGGGTVIFNGTVLQGGPFQPARDTPPPTGHSAIRGRIVDADGGQPMRRAMVRVSAPSPQITRSMLTDADGRYEFRDLPAGRYSINASKTAYVGWSYGQTQPQSPGKPFTLADNQSADSVDIRLPRGSVITGHVTDDFGDPAIGVAVTLMRQQFVQGQRRMAPVGGRATTNDIGEFRIFGVTPGQYFVSATGTQLNGVVEGAEARTGYAPTYYPGTADEAAAQKVSVGMSQTVSEINIRLLPTQLATVSGTAVDSQGRPLAGGAVNLQRRGGLIGLGGGGVGPIKRDGSFSIANVAPGEYVARANVPRPPPVQTPPATPGGLPTLPTPQEFSVAVVTVNGADVAGILLAPIAPVSVKGRVVFDDPAAAQSMKASTIRVTAQPLSQDNLFPTGPPPALADDFTFELKVVPGPTALRANVTGQLPAAATGPAPAGTSRPVWVVKSIRANGTDITDNGVEVGAQGLTGVEIELTSRLSELSGTVADGRGNVVKDYAVVVFAQDRARWTAAVNRYSSLARPGDDGGYKISTLPPGQYYAIALDRVDPIGWQDPDFLEGLSRQASTFSLTQGEMRTLDLRLFTVQ